MSGYDVLRKRRLNATARYVATKKHGIAYEELIGWLMAEFGLTEKKSREYIKVLGWTNQLKTEKGKVFAL